MNMLKAFFTRLCLSALVTVVLSACNNTGFVVSDFAVLENYSNKLNDTLYQINAD